MRNVKYYISVDVYGTIKMLNIPKQIQTFIKVSSKGTLQGLKRATHVLALLIPCQVSSNFRNVLAPGGNIVVVLFMGGRVCLTASHSDCRYSLVNRVLA